MIRNPFTWESSKRCLRNRSIAIEEPFEQPVFTTKSLRPEPIPLDVKVILIGRADVYGLLLEYDDQFRELFKVKADFDYQMARTDENIREYAGFVYRLCENEHLIPWTRPAWRVLSSMAPAWRMTRTGCPPALATCRYNTGGELLCRPGQVRADPGRPHRESHR